jgi:hypothetical protein
VNKRPLRDFIIYCDRGSDTARELSRRLGARRLVAAPRARLRSTAGSLVVNYGTGHNPIFKLGDKSLVLNRPEVIHNAISKVKSHDLLRKAGVPTLEQTTVRSEASKWVQDGSGVLCRRDGLSGGKGIVFIPKGSKDCPVADFYTKYFAKTHEFRAHVVSGRLIDLTQKRLKNGMAKTDSAESVARIVRSLDNGWIHAHEFHVAENTRKAIEKVAVEAVAALGLDFGAVDILAKPNKKTPQGVPELVVCEVNTAPGLGNEVTLKAYVDALSNIYNSTSDKRYVVVARPKRRKVRKEVMVWITTRRGKKVQRPRMRTFYE